MKKRHEVDKVKCININYTPIQLNIVPRKPQLSLTNKKALFLQKKHMNPIIDLQKQQVMGKLNHNNCKQARVSKISLCHNDNCRSFSSLTFQNIIKCQKIKIELKNEDNLNVIQQKQEFFQEHKKLKKSYSLYGNNQNTGLLKLDESSKHIRVKTSDKNLSEKKISNPLKLHLNHYQRFIQKEKQQNAPKKTNKNFSISSLVAKRKTLAQKLEQQKMGLNKRNKSSSLGPGSYNIDLNTIKIKHKEPKFQFFNCTSLRFKQLQNNSRKQKNKLNLDINKSNRQKLLMKNYEEKTFLIREIVPLSHLKINIKIDDDTKLKENIHIPPLKNRSSISIKAESVKKLGRSKKLSLFSTYKCENTTEQPLLLIAEKEKICNKQNILVSRKSKKNTKIMTRKTIQKSSQVSFPIIDESLASWNNDHKDHQSDQFFIMNLRRNRNQIVQNQKSNQ